MFSIISLVGGVFYPKSSRGVFSITILVGGMFSIVSLVGRMFYAISQVGGMF